MTTADYLNYIVNEIHRTIVATVDEEGLPVTCAIDMMDCDEDSLYFLTAKGKAFYELFQKNPYMNEIYPTEESRKALTVFQIYEGSGEWFDLSKKPIERASFTFGKTETAQSGYFINDNCIGCGSCLEVCPQQCIDVSKTPAVIHQENCLHCGNCKYVCPVGAVEKR